MINHVTLIGNLGKDPEVRRLENGAAVAKFSLATNESYKDREGNQVKQTEWHNIVCWRGLAEVAEKYLKKGSLIYLEGKLTYREYTDKDNQKKYFTEIVANTFKMLDRKGDGGGGGYFPGSENEPTSHPSPKSDEPAAPVANDDSNGESPADDLPF